MWKLASFSFSNSSEINSLTFFSFCGRFLKSISPRLSETVPYSFKIVSISIAGLIFSSSSIICFLSSSIFLLSSSSILSFFSSSTFLFFSFSTSFSISFAFSSLGLNSATSNSFDFALNSSLVLSFLGNS